jgi:hypothetical protein
MTSSSRVNACRRAAPLNFPAVAFVALALVTMPGCTDDTGGWRSVLVFDVLATTGRMTADLDDGNLLVALRDPGFGWDIGIYRRPFRADSDNLLYGGRNLHGVQPWFVFAWTTRDRVFPDVREIDYGSPARRIRIELAGCDTRKDGEKVVFTRGTIRISWRP